MKLILIIFLLLVGFTAISQKKTIYDFEVPTIEGDTISLSKFKGKKIMIVNTASKCMYTPQYEQLETVYEKYKDLGFVIIGFPSNDFFNQAPGTDAEIKAFCTKNYGVTFPMMSKIHVKGKQIAPLYQYLTSKQANGVVGKGVRWNFQKYLIGRDGKIDKMYSSKVVPNAPEIIKWIKE